MCVYGRWDHNKYIKRGLRGELCSGGPFYNYQSMFSVAARDRSGEVKQRTGILEDLIGCGLINDGDAYWPYSWVF